MADTYYTELAAYLRSEQESLRAQQAPDLETCLKIGSDQDNERKKHWVTLVKMQGRFTPEQQQELHELTLQICAGVSEGSRENPSSARGQSLEVAEEGVDSETFARVISILQQGKEELKSLEKLSLTACFSGKLMVGDKDGTFCRNFFQRKQGECSAEQKRILQEWTSEICKPAASADGASLRAAAVGVDPETFARVIRILQEREEELKSLGKDSLLACFNAKRKNADKDWTFCRNFFERKQHQCSAEQKKS